MVITHTAGMDLMGRTVLTLYSPGYWTTDKTYFIEANAYDAETQQLIWSVQSKADNPSGIEKSSREYTEMLFEQFDKERKKQK